MIDLQDLSFSYEERRVFSGLSFSLSGGCVYGLTGARGSGKSSLLKLLTGLLIPERGRCGVLGYRPSERSPDFLERIFFVPQQYSLPSIRIRKFVAVHAPFYRRFDILTFERLLDRAEISLDSSIRRLSPAANGLVLPFFALASACPAVFMDEPMRFLNESARLILADAIRDTLSHRRLVLLSSRKSRDFQGLTSNLLSLSEGRIESAAPAGEVVPGQTVRAG